MWCTELRPSVSLSPCNDKVPVSFEGGSLTFSNVPAPPNTAVIRFLYTLRLRLKVETSDLRIDAEQCRRQLRRIMDSRDFASRRQLSDFLLYVSEAAFQGRTHLHQIEIAEHVLHAKDFNPIEDASVRKIATLTRQLLLRAGQTGHDYRRASGAVIRSEISQPR
jgi:hypothetical protein